MRKFLAAALFLMGSLSAEWTEYTLLSTVHPDKILVREIKHISVSGFDSHGHSITLWHETTTEKFFDLYEAFDIGIRYHSTSIVLEALSKLERLGWRIDVTEPIVVVCDEIKNTMASLKPVKIMASIIAGCGLIPLFGFSMAQWRERVIAGAVFPAFGAFVWWAARSNSRERVKNYGNVLRVLVTSPACYIANRTRASMAVMEIISYLDSGTSVAIMQNVLGVYSQSYVMRS